MTLNSKEAGSLVSRWSYDCGVQRASRDDVSPHSNTPADAFAPTTATRAASVRTLTIIFVELLRSRDELGGGGKRQSKEERRDQIAKNNTHKWT